ncbi:MAG: hypothetical protein QOI08_1613 [Actinomycetota bacterium]|jgi:hypothetical protein|nr:hypothetical protein [Actinomycetota bacterium]
MRRIGRLLLLLAVLLPAGVIASAAANGDGGIGSAVLECDSFVGTFTSSPGITHTPSNQSLAGAGRMYGCKKSGGSAVFTATLHMPHGSCAFLAMSGSAKFTWPSGKTTFTTLTFDPKSGEPGKFFVGGNVGSGLYHGLIVRSGVRFTPVMSGPGACTAANPLTQINFTSINSVQLLPPHKTTTTVSRPHTTTSVHTSSSTAPTATTAGGSSTTTDPNQNVPVTNQGSTAPQAVLVASTDPSGTGTGGSGNATSVLAFTGNNRFGALLGVESLIVGGALACFGKDRRSRRVSLWSRAGARSWLKVTLPPGE